MYGYKYFQTEQAAREWMRDNADVYTCGLIFVNQETEADAAYCVEYKVKRVILWDSDHE